MKKYKVVGSSRPEFMNIEMSLVFDDISIGKQCEVFGTRFTITQPGKILVLSNEDWVLTLQELEAPKPITWTTTIDNHRDLRVNFEIDLFFDRKAIRLNRTERLSDKNGVTVRCVYLWLRNEWKYIGPTINKPFPFRWDEENLLMSLLDEWNFDGLETISLLREGSFSRYSADGRCI